MALIRNIDRHTVSSHLQRKKKWFKCMTKIVSVYKEARDIKLDWQYGIIQERVELKMVGDYNK